MIRSRMVEWRECVPVLIRDTRTDKSSRILHADENGGNVSFSFLACCHPQGQGWGESQMLSSLCKNLP